jgi:serine/threonine protein kinase
MTRLSRTLASKRAAGKGHTTKSIKQRQQPKDAKFAAGHALDSIVAAGQALDSIVPTLQSKFKSLLSRLEPRFAGRHHTGSEQLHFDYQLSSEVVGSGSSGDVMLARSKADTTKLYAVKKIMFNTLRSLEDWHLLEVELEVLLCADAPNVVSACDVYEDLDALHIVLPYMAGGHLVPAVQSEHGVSNVAYQMIAGMKYLHEFGMIHRDIKPENFVLEGPGGKLGIIDFGLSAFWMPGDKKLQLHCGTRGYMSPEMRTGKGYTNKADIWSFGISVFQLFTGELPFSLEGVPPSQQEVDARIASAISMHSHLAQHFLASLLKVDPCARPTAAEALQHPWFTCSGMHTNVFGCGDIYNTTPNDTDMLLQKWDRSLLRRSEDPPGSRWADLFDDEDDHAP